MLTRRFHSNDVRALIIPSLAIVLSACSARLLDVGSTDAGPGSSNGTTTNASGQPVAYAAGCAAGACTNQAYACESGEVTNLRCIPDPNAGVGSDPAGSCILSGECASGGVASCTTAPPAECGQDSSGNSVCAAVGGGGGLVSVELDPAGGDAAAATSILSVYFNHGVETGNGQALGACVFNPYGNETEQSGEVGAAAPNPGIVTASGPALALTASPACSGLYAPMKSPETFAAGDVVTFAWKPPSLDPDRFPTSLPSIPAPHAIALAAGQSFTPGTPPIPRGTDAPIAWTVTGTPMALEQVVVQLTQGIATVTCAFDASAGSGVVPADALLKLNAAEASYAVYSSHSSELKDSSTDWDVTFQLVAVASTPNGPAKGTTTLE